jgi:hypothetical protein
MKMHWRGCGAAASAQIGIVKPGLIQDSLGLRATSISFEIKAHTNRKFRANSLSF